MPSLFIESCPSAFCCSSKMGEVCFIVSSSEHKDWKQHSKFGIKVPVFNSLAETATFIYESGWFIGNDSGVGHLASNLGIPTLSLILRPSLARSWRPNFCMGKVILPTRLLLIRKFKEKFWKYFVSVNKVYKGFLDLKSAYEK